MLSTSHHYRKKLIDGLFSFSFHLQNVRIAVLFITRVCVIRVEYRLTTTRGRVCTPQIVIINLRYVRFFFKQITEK